MTKGIPGSSASGPASEWPGKSFGVPESGPGAVAHLGQRVGAFLLDCLIGALVAWAFTAPEPPQNWSLLVWGVMTVAGVAFVGTTPGHLIAGTRVATLRTAGRSPLVGAWAIPRTVLIGLLVPPLIMDKDGRGLHDRLCYTVVVRTR
ncbi:MAG: RDD family protein [Nakamurella sp.]